MIFIFLLPILSIYFLFKIILFKKFFLLKYSWFTILCKFQVRFSYIYIYIYIYIYVYIFIGEGSGTPLQYSCLENPMDGGAWWAAIRGVAKSRTRLSDFTFTFHFHALEKEMATHSNVLAWKIPGTGEPGGLPSMGSHRVGHDWSDLAAYILIYILFPLEIIT